MQSENHYPQFFTATCLDKLYAFVLMPNHLHYIWGNHPSLLYSKIKGSHLRNTAQKIKHDLILNKKEQMLDKFYVGAKDRAYPF